MWAELSLPYRAVHLVLIDTSGDAPGHAGRELVLWRDNEGEWRCFQDLCPHRWAS